MIFPSPGGSHPRRSQPRTAACLLAAVCLLLPVGRGFGKACVWRVTSGGHTLYLAGSVHALRGKDYPLPSSYEQAFQASSGLAFETDLRQIKQDSLVKVAYLPPGTTLRDHLDPRVYAYILQVIRNVHGSTEPEKKLEHLRPWAVGMLLHGPRGIDGVSSGEGVDVYLLHKAIQARKAIVGLVPLDEQFATLGAMNDQDSQTFLLLSFIHLNQADASYQKTVQQWKRGDVDGIDRSIQEEYQDAPSLYRRIFTDRNKRWLPEIVQFLQSGKTYTVVAGAGHMAGGEGLPALLKAQGFQVEQL